MSVYADEGEAEKGLKELLVMHNCWCRKMHGNLLQPGIPDFIIGTPKGFLFYQENKFWRQGGKPSKAIHFTALLRPSQRVTLMAELWPRKIFAPICIFNQLGACFLYDGYRQWDSTIDILPIYYKALSCNPLLSL